MRLFTRNNGITEGFHTKMEVLQRQAYGVRNFDNYRLRVRLRVREFQSVAGLVARLRALVRG